jgi:hypothetical protein
MNDRFQNVAGLGDMGKVNFGLYAFRFATAGTRGLGGRSRFPLKMGAYFLCLVFFQRTRMRLFLGDPNFRKHIENCLAFYFQLSGQIVDSNLTHPPLVSSELFPLSLHVNLTAQFLLRAPCKMNLQQSAPPRTYPWFSV